MKYRHLFFLVIAILSFSASNCSGDCDDCGESEPFIATTYIYKNNSDYSINIKVFDINQTQFKEYNIATMDSISLSYFAQNGSRINPPFRFADDETLIGHSVLIEYNNEKCVNYEAYDQGIFDVRNYDNYSPAMQYSKFNTLIFTFDNSDYDSATICP